MKPDAFDTAISFVLAWGIVFIVAEMVALIAFGFIRAIHARKKLDFEFGKLAKDVNRKPVFTLKLDLDWAKGVLERMVLSVGLLSGFAHVLTFFGALKIATGLNARAEDKDAPGYSWNLDYFLTGNLVSALLAIVSVLIARLLQPLILSAIQISHTT